MERVDAGKSHSGHGLDEEWRISHEELTHIQNEGLLPLKKFAEVTPSRRLKSSRSDLWLAQIPAKAPTGRTETTNVGSTLARTAATEFSAGGDRRRNAVSLRLDLH